MEPRNDNRDSALRRWVPMGFYGINVALWFATGIAAEAWDLLYLVLLPLSVVAVYIWRTR